MSSSIPDIPKFRFNPPKGYLWLIERDLVGFEPFSKLQPWFFVDASGTFDASKEWPSGASKNSLVVFARRQDNDDLACFEIGPDGICGVTVIHGWVGDSYAIVAQHGTFWNWLETVVSDIRDWCDNSGNQ